MAKNYLSLEEAAEKLGISQEELLQLRDRKEIRGFADLGSWKFREQDIEEYLRSQQAGSSPDIPIITDPSASVLDDDDDDMSASDSDVRLYFEDDDEITSGGELGQSGSDVRLKGDSGPKLDASLTDDEDIDLSDWADDDPSTTSDSDSDVKLVGARTDADIDLAQTTALDDSDSDVLLAGDVSDLAMTDSDSDVRLMDDTASRDDSGIALIPDVDSDSDVKLTGADDVLGGDSDSDVQLGGGLDRTDSDIRLVDEPASKGTPKKDTEISLFPEDSDLKLIPSGSRVRADEPDSGITLAPAGSALSLGADESGISLDIDSGISLSADDSGISLESFDSGAKLGTDDSGISFESADSGIALSIDDDSGISLDAGDDMGRTMPMQAIPDAAALLSESNAHTTAFEVPKKQTGADSEFELAGLDDDDDLDTSTSVLKFDDDDFDAAADKNQTQAIPAAKAKPPAGGKPNLAKKPVVEDDFEDDVVDEFEDDEFEEDLFEDDVDAMDADDFSDDDFEDDQPVGTGGGSVRPAGRSAYADVDWGMGTKIMIGFGSLLSIVCALIGIELVRTMWLWTQPGAQSSPILDLFAGIF